ncbi:penicillin-binding protein [Romboutsia maritimum]|uniref:Penicillin-binding protein n=1 Tax=Romboutsia maritimum TaxID=2020948 RepID=A0A371IUA2_9FIRM|nr:penicillin-binding transpeptidase domain-containing protein [Romboutsia maritimum]RDY24041.1 penicillin-binding protein [Romboutsia maritimum]
MEENKKNDRFIIMKNIILVVFVIILLRIVYMTTFKYEHYKELAENKTYKELPVKAARGEIRDKFGRLLAGNKNLFTVQVSGDGINRTDSDGKSMANDISLKIIKLLEENNEEYIDEFPIYTENGKYYYTFDKNIREYKKNNGIPDELNAKESFYYLVDKLVDEGLLSQEEKKLDSSKLQSKLNENGYYPPILVKKWIFTEEKNKNDWLGRYKIDDLNVSAKKAFEQIRTEDAIYKIDSRLSDADARKILVVRDLIKSQGYSQYNPVTIAKDISESTIAQIEESAIDLPGVSVSIEPVRYYPNGSLASHVIGYMGKMSSTQEDSYLSKTEKKYSKGDMIGTAGIESSYEGKLKGTDGYKKVQVDALGRVTKELEVSEPKSGETVYLSIDKDLQEVAESSLKRTLEVARSGGTFESDFGNKTVSGTAPNAKSGAVMAIDVKTGDVLATASYPDFDPSKFVTGISYEDYQALQPENKNDLLAPSSLLNLSTQGVFQPGSTFKMITGMAALENGLDPNYTISDPGVVYLGNRPFGDYVWHKFKKNHGSTNLYKAIQESCNIYFYTIATGKNWTGGKNPSESMSADKILEYAKLFGLNERTGLSNEIEERAGSVPSKEQKLITTQATLRNYLSKEMQNVFTDITKAKNPEKYNERIEEIVSWAAEDKTPGRVEAMERLTKLKVKENKVESLADNIVFSYLNFAKWSTADTFNLAIGQGENAYTPAQMVRYAASIANGGNLVDLSVIDRSISNDYSSVDIDTNSSKKIPFKNNDNLKHLVEGMKRVTTVSGSKTLFANLGVTVAAKTGTAEKSGKIPTANEYEYLLKNISAYGVSVNDAKKLAGSLKKEKEAKLTKEKEEEIKDQLKSKDLKEEERKKLEEELKEGVSVKLEDSDKVNATYLRKAIKELNPKLSDDKIDQYKSNYGSFAWSVAFAPADNPEIAVVAMIPQGEESSFALLPVREMIGKYFGLTKDDTKSKNKEESNQNEGSDSSTSKENKGINFTSQIKK